jgi:hypothetical protein
MRATLSSLAVAATLLAALPASAVSQAPAPGLLSDGRVHVVEEANAGQAGKTFTAFTLMAASVPQLCGTVQDYAAYASYMPNTRSALPVASGDGYVLVDMTLDLPLGQVKKYRLRLEPSSDAGQCKLAWRLVPRAELDKSETIADTSGYWLFKPAAGGEQTLVEYHVYADPGPVPFGFGWIVDMMSKRSLPRTLEALRGQVAKP